MRKPVGPQPLHAHPRLLRSIRTRRMAKLRRMNRPLEAIAEALGAQALDQRLRAPPAQGQPGRARLNPKGRVQALRSALLTTKTMPQGPRVRRPSASLPN